MDSKAELCATLRNQLKQALQGVPQSEIQAESPSWSRVNKTTFQIWFILDK